MPNDEKTPEYKRWKGLLFYGREDTAPRIVLHLKDGQIVPKDERSKRFLDEYKDGAYSMLENKVVQTSEGVEFLKALASRFITSSTLSADPIL